MLILLVEDDSVLRSALHKILANKGFDTIQAHNGIDAYRLVQQIGSNIDLLLTDINVPGMDGLSLADPSICRWTSFPHSSALVTIRPVSPKATACP